MVVCKMRQIRLGICYAIGCCAISNNRTGGNNYSAIKDSFLKKSIHNPFIIVSDAPTKVTQNGWWKFLRLSKRQPMQNIAADRGFVPSKMGRLPSC